MRLVRVPAVTPPLHASGGAHTHTLMPLCMARVGGALLRDDGALGGPPSGGNAPQTHRGRVQLLLVIDAPAHDLARYFAADRLLNYARVVVADAEDLLFVLPVARDGSVHRYESCGEEGRKHSKVTGDSYIETNHIRSACRLRADIVLCLPG